MVDIVKSVFRRKEVEKRFDLTKRYYNDWFGGLREDFEVSVSYKLIEDKEIGNYDIEIPMLEIGDKFFLDDIKEQVVITDRMRNSNGSITYYVEDKVIETENTSKSYEECQLVAKTMFKDLQKEYDEYRSKYKYERRFLNFKEAKQS